MSIILILVIEMYNYTSIFFVAVCIVVIIKGKVTCGKLAKPTHNCFFFVKIYTASRSIFPIHFT